MNDIRIPDWQSRGRGFVSLILQGTLRDGHITIGVVGNLRCCIGRGR